MDSWFHSGRERLAAAIAARPKRPLTFTATGIAGSASKLVLTTSPTPSPQRGFRFRVKQVVQLEDANGNLVSQAGIAVTAAIGSGGGSLRGGPTATTDAGELPAPPILQSLGQLALAQSFTAPGFVSATASINLTPGTATSMSVAAGNNQTADAGTAVLIKPQVIVADADGNPVSGVAVTFSLADGGGTFAAPNQTTTAGGIASLGSWFLGPLAGTDDLTASTSVGSVLLFSGIRRHCEAPPLAQDSALIGACGHRPNSEPWRFRGHFAAQRSPTRTSCRAPERAPGLSSGSISPTSTVSEAKNVISTSACGN